MKTFNAVILGALILLTIMHFLIYFSSDSNTSIDSSMGWFSASLWCLEALTLRK